MRTSCSSHLSILFLFYSIIDPRNMTTTNRTLESHKTTWDKLLPFHLFNSVWLHTSRFQWCPISGHLDSKWLSSIISHHLNKLTINVNCRNLKTVLKYVVSTEWLYNDGTTVLGLLTVHNISRTSQGSTFNYYTYNCTVPTYVHSLS
jgi:hypothetical protein